MMSREELVEIVGRLMRGEGTEAEEEEDLEKLFGAVPHPSPTDFIADTAREWTAEEIVDACLSYEAVALGSPPKPEDDK